MDTEIIVGLLGLVGIATGAVLSGIGYIMRVIAERMSTRNNVLYHLFEIRKSIEARLVSPSDFSKEFFDYIEDYFSNRESINSAQDVSDELRSNIVSQFSNFHDVAKPSIDADFVRSFNDAVSELAKDKPVLAYRLKQSIKFDRLLNLQNQYIDNLNVSILPEDTPQEIQDVTSKHATDINLEVISGLLDDIDENIKRVSGFHQISVRKLLKKRVSTDIAFDPKEYGPILDKLVDDIKSQASSIDSVNRP